MNLEDFKSFRRVLKPSEVGSIPTHSRHSSRALVAWAVAAAVAALAAPASFAAEPPPLQPSAFQRAVRSAMVPAWGQLTNGKSKKAAVLFSVQSYLITRIIVESRAASESERRVAALEGMGGTDAASLAALDAAQASAQDHFDTRRDLLFWALVAGFYGAIDAYVDAHLGDFSGDLEESRGVFGGVDPAAKSVQVGVRF